MWHSCGTHTLEELFGRSTAPTLDLARQFVELLRGVGDVQVLVQATRLVAVARVRFAGCTPRSKGFVVSFALRRRLDDPRIARHVEYGPRWQVHEVRVQETGDLDPQLRAWLQESYDVVGLQAPDVPTP